MKVLLAVLLLTACAHARPDGPPDTEVTVADESGSPLLGTIRLAGAGEDKCVLYGASCTVSLPAGDYAMTFTKERAGRPGSQIGGTVQSEKSAGCLRATVHLAPGVKISCRKKADFSCAAAATETMDCAGG